MLRCDFVEFVADEIVEDLDAKELLHQSGLGVEDLCFEGLDTRRLEKFREHHADRDSRREKCEDDQRRRDHQVVEDPECGAHAEAPVGDRSP